MGNITDLKIGTTATLREENGKKTKLVEVALKKLEIDKYNYAALHKKSESAGVPRVLEYKEIGTRCIRTEEWVEGTDMLILKPKWEDKMFAEWGVHMAKLHNAGVSVYDLFPRNVIWTGERCVCVDKNKFYESSFPEYDILKDIIFNYNIEQHLKDAFIFGYGIHRSINLRTLLNKLIDNVQDGYQDITLNGELIKKSARTNRKISLVKEEDIKGKVAYDLGCSIGELTRSLCRYKPLRVYGFDAQSRGRYNLSVLSQMLAYLEGLNNCYFFHLNIEHPGFKTKYGGVKVDTTFFCAVLGHIKGDRKEFLKTLDEMTKTTLYYETNLGGKKEAALDLLMETTSFKNFEYLGDTSDADRGHAGYHFFRCTR